MIAEFAFLLAAGGALAAFIFGVCVGARVERRGWALRADGDTPHYCDGEFYAVFREKTFLAQYQRRKIVPPQGGSGTAVAKAR